MKVLAIVCGRPNQTTERLARIALKGAKNAGAEIELVNLMKLDIRACINCRACTRQLIDPGFYGRCVHESDDMKWLDEQYLSSDALIYAAPMYECAVPGSYKIMCDRLGPSHDVTFLKDIYDQRAAAGKDPMIDPRWFKKRPASFIGHGGSEWSYLSFPTLASPAVTLGLTIVDYLRFDWSSRGLLLDERSLKRVEKSGEHLVKMCGLDPEDMTYIGPEGACPVCHCDVMRINPRTGEVFCALCGAPGQLTAREGGMEIYMDENARKQSHVLDSGREIHMIDLRRNAQIKATLNTAEIERRMRPLQDEIPLSVPQRVRQGKPSDSQ